MLSKCTERREDRQKLSSRDTARERRASRSKCKPLSAWGRRVLQCLAAMTLLVLHGRDASAAGSCQDAFAAWAKLSERHVRAVQPSRGDARGACIASEAVRKELLDELMRTRARCTEPSSAPDPSSQQARTILAINENFIGSLGLCPVEGASAPTGAATGWTTKSAPPPSAPPPSAPPKAVARPCLQISHPKQEHYTLTNRHCAGKAVLAIVETRGTAGKVECKAYTIHQALALRAHADKPYVNHECVLNQDRCSKEHLGRMFPECDW